MKRFALIFLLACDGGARSHMAAVDAAVPLADAGSCFTSPFRTGEACGECGLWQCERGTDLRCVDPGRNACGECGPLPGEMCNGRDDNCDGVVDERCIVRVGANLPGFATDIRVEGSLAALLTSNPGIAGGATMVNLETSRAEVLAANIERSDSHIATDGRYIAWKRGPERNETGDDIWVYDTWHGAGRVIFSAPTAGPPAIDSGVVAFRGGNLGRDILLWNSSDGSVRTITRPESVDHVDLSGEWLVHDSCSACTSAIWAVHLPSGRVVELSEDVTGSHTSPSIDGAQVVWQHTVAGASSVYHYDLVTNIRRSISANEEQVTSAPRVSGNFVCFASKPQGSSDYWSTGSLLNILTGQRLPLGSEYASSCDISGSKVVWIDPSTSQARMRIVLAGEL